MNDGLKKGLRKRFALIVAGSILAIGVFAFGSTSGTQSSTKSLIGSPAAAYTLQNLDGKTVSSAAHKGKVVILDFWATWCPPCRMEIPSFIELQKKYEKKGFTFVGISLDQDGPQVVKDFAAKYGMNYPQLMGSYEVVTNYGSFEAIPTTFVIDRKGTIRRVLQGYHPQSVFESEIQKLLGER